MALFNKQLLLESQDNIDLFKLHLPDPKLLIKQIYEEDNVDLLRMIEYEVSIMITFLGKSKIHNKTRRTNIINNIFVNHQKIPINILGHYTRRNVKLGKEFSIMLKQFLTKSTGQEIEYITFCIYMTRRGNKYNDLYFKQFDIFSKMSPISKESVEKQHLLYKKLEKLENHSIKSLISLDEIESEDIYIEYIKWLIELSSLTLVKFGKYEFIIHDIITNNPKIVNLTKTINCKELITPYLSLDLTLYKNLDKYSDKHYFTKNLYVIDNLVKYFGNNV